MNCKITLYYLSSEDDFSYTSMDNIDIKDPNGDIIAAVNSSFFASLAVEGCGKLQDGRVINVAGWRLSTTDEQTILKNISNLHYRGRSIVGLSTSGKFIMTFSVVPNNWGYGNKGNELIPFKDVAADPNVYQFGTKLYISELNGLSLPDGSKHDGYVVVGDVGSGIIGEHLDFFTGTKSNSRYINVPNVVSVSIV